MLQNASLVAIVAVHTAKNEPSEVADEVPDFSHMVLARFSRSHRERRARLGELARVAAEQLVAPAPDERVPADLSRGFFRTFDTP